MTATVTQQYEIDAANLRKSCGVLTYDFEISESLPPGTAHLGQQRAIDAIRFGVQMDTDGYNIFVLGPPGSQRHGIAIELTNEHALTRDAPSDWCYVNNFADSERPRALQFPAGLGVEFRDDMRDLIDEMKIAIPAAFESEDYQSQIKTLETEAQEELETLWKAQDERASQKGIGVMHTPTGYVLAPVRDGKVLSEDEFGELPKSEQKKVQSSIRTLSKEFQSSIEQIQRLRKKHRERVKLLNRETAAHAVGVLIEEVARKYKSLPPVAGYLNEVERHITENAQDFLETEPSALPFLSRDPSLHFAQYDVNLVVEHEANANAPVVYESNPNYPNIIGKIEHRAEMGALVTDFRLIRSGALHRANGGYLILDAQRVLSRPFVWEALKQALLAQYVRIESPGETYGLVSTTTLQPEPIPLEVKIVLVGERWLYYLLGAYDSEFNDLFKVAADLDDDVKRTDENVGNYVLMIADRIRERDLLPFSSSAIRRVIEQRARAADDSERLSTHMRSLDDLLMQSSFWARQDNSKQVEAAHVKEAIDKAIRRLNRTQTKIVDAINRNVLLIDTSGSRVGQVNGLSVVDLGGHRFGHPVRITATTRMGTGDLVDIEREVELGGAIHSKGMMILSAALTSRYATDVPLALQGSVVFEQSYGAVEGDSASVAELSALLSSLSGDPIRQNLAVTGSINQLGRVQVVGGINEKIEGFFDVCKSRGLDGSHGVIIPRDNVKHLMLREDVVEAAENGEFRVYAVQTIDEALTILTGREAGHRDEAGSFPDGSVNEKVERRLVTLAKLRKQFGEGEEKDDVG